MTFEEYLTEKRIDSAAFRQSEPEVWKNWMDEFGQMSARSFTARKLYRINSLRRKFPSVVDTKKPPPSPLPRVKPVIKPKIS